MAAREEEHGEGSEAQGPCKRPRLLRQLTMGESELKSAAEDALMAATTAVAAAAAPSLTEQEQKEDEEEAPASDNEDDGAAAGDGFNVRTTLLPFSAAMFAATPRPGAGVVPSTPRFRAAEEEEEGLPAPSVRLERMESWQEDVTDSSWRAW